MFFIQIWVYILSNLTRKKHKLNDEINKKTNGSDNALYVNNQAHFSLHIVVSCVINVCIIFYVRPLTTVVSLLICLVYAVLLDLKSVKDEVSKGVVVFLAVLLYVITPVKTVIDPCGTAFLLYISVSNALIVYNFIGKKKYRLLYSALFVLNIAMTLLISKYFFNEIAMILQIPNVFFYPTALVFLWFCAANIAYDRMENIEVFLYRYLPMIMCLLMIIINMNCMYVNWNVNHRGFYEFLTGIRDKNKEFLEFKHLMSSFMTYMRLLLI